MSTQADTHRETEPPEDLAGAFVLGVLDTDDWRAASARLASDPVFAAEVRAWEARLTPMIEALESQMPSRDLWPEIRRALPANDVGGGMGNVSLWRGLTAASGFIAVASLVAVLVLGKSGPVQLLTTPTPPNSVAVTLQPPAPEPLQVALLKPEKGPTAFVATLDRTRKEMTVSPGAATAPKGKALELWMIAPGGKPQALGVIPADHSAKMPMPDAFAGKGSTPIVLAVSVEPVGGSTTGQPTGPVVASGTFVAV